MLTQLTLENFKAWRTVDLPFGSVTGFFGTNSAGKSSLLQFLLLLKQTKNATDRGSVLNFGGSSDFVNLGTFKDVIHRHDERKRLSWHLEWSLPEPLEINDPMGSRDDFLFKGDTLQIASKVGLRKTRLWSYGLAYNFSDANFTLRPRPKRETEYRLGTSRADFRFVRNPGRAWPLPGPVKSHLFPDQAKTFFQNAHFLGEFELEYENLMDSIYYLGPLRDHPKREYHWGGSSPEDVGPRGERTVDAILAATHRGEMRSLGYWKRRKPFQAMIAHWLKELGLIQEFRLEELAKGTNVYRAMVKTTGSGAQTLLTDVGFGVSQVLPALVLLYYVPEGSVVLMEQPEIHLHPAVQSKLADVILNVAEARKVQIIVESHSEHLMRRLQRRVAEGESSSDDVKLYFVRAGGRSARLSDLVLNKWGEIENWPDNFFGDEMGEIAAIAKASLNRKMKQSQ